MADDVFKGLPRKVAIGQYTFRIQVVESTDPRLEDRDGITLTGEQRVFLSESQNPQTALNTVQHELSHCINWARDVTDDSDEETFVTQHTYGLVELWLRNPRMHAWLNKMVRQVRKASHG